MRTSVRLVLSLVLGLLLLIPLGALYGALSLPVYHSWGLTHGSFTTAVPVLVTASYLALGLIPWFGGQHDAAPRIAASVAALVLVTTLFWVDQAAQHSWSMWHFVVYSALFIVFAVLCALARRPLLLPLFLLVPLALDPLFGLLMTGSIDLMGFEIFSPELLVKVMPAALATGASLALITVWRLRGA